VTSHRNESAADKHHIVRVFGALKIAGACGNQVFALNSQRNRGRAGGDVKISTLVFFSCNLQHSGPHKLRRSVQS